MNFAALLSPFRGFRTEARQPAAPEPLRVRPRPTVGLWSTLTDEQRQAALSYRGAEVHGDPNFRRNAN